MKRLVAHAIAGVAGIGAVLFLLCFFAFTGLAVIAVLRNGGADTHYFSASTICFVAFLAAAFVAWFASVLAD
jgi:hypothetical protein